MKVVERKISDLKESEYNPRLLTKSEYADLKRSLQEFGFVDPVIVNMNKDRENVIVGGHQRVKVWRDLGHDTVPCTEIDLTYEKERELNIRLNKNTGSWDYDVLANFFDIDELVDWGFTQSELQLGVGSGVEDEIDENDDVIEEMEIRQYEHHDYIVLLFEESHDFLFALHKLGVKKIKIPEKKRIGLGRVIDGKKIMQRFFPHDYANFTENNTE